MPPIAPPRPTLNPALRTVRCSFSGSERPFAPGTPLGLCDCCSPKKPLTLHYESETLQRGFRRLSLAMEPGSSPGRAARERERSLGRYSFALPVDVDNEAYFAGVGCTPTVFDERLSHELDVDVFVKYEGHNPSGSFKDRGLSIAVALGAALGAKRFCLPTQGNAGVAAALFSARLGLPPCRVWMPTSHEGSVYHRLARHFGAEVTLSGGNIAEAGGAMRINHAEELSSGEVVDVSTFFEPGRLEGKKTLGFEIFESFGQELPEMIVYPTGGGTGLVGIWKAFEELLLASMLPEGVRLPRLVAVQSEGCAPVVRAFEASDDEVRPVVSRGTLADGLNVPAAIMGHGILRAIRASRGTALAVTEGEIERDFHHLAMLGVSAGLEASATLSALRRLVQQGHVKKRSRVLLLSTSGPFAAALV